MITPIRIDNFPVEQIKARSLINNTGGSLAGAVSLVLQNTANFAIADPVLVGPLGTQQCEEVVLAANPPSVTALTVPALSFPHNEFEDVIAIKYDKIKIYTATNTNGYIPAPASFTLLTTLPITPNMQYTDYVDPAGSSSLWYAWTYLNSTTNAETNFNVTERVVLGANANEYCTIDDIRGQAGLEGNPWITDGMIAIERKKAQNEIDSRLFSMYTVPFQAPVPAFVQDIAIRLSSGRLLTKDYGTSSTGSSKDGDAMLKDARADLLDIDDREMVLLDADSQSLLAVEQAGGVASWPNNTTQIFTNNGGSNYGGNYDDQVNPAPGFDYGHIVSMNTRF